MTTIAYKGGVLSFDSLVTADGYRIGKVVKGIKTDKHLVAVAGDVETIPEIFRWAKTGFLAKSKPKIKATADFEAVVVDRKGNITVFGSSLVMLSIEGDMYTAGTGSVAALGALYAGCSPQEAVRAGILVDTLSGGPVRSVTFLADNQEE